MSVVRKFEQMVGDSAAHAGVPTDKEKIDWLYSVLTILDTKAGALLAFDGLLLAAASFMYEKISENVGWLKVISLLLILVALAAALWCLFVARVSYSFLGNVTLGTHDNAPEIDALGNAVERRTSHLWWAWRASVGAVVFFILVVIIKLVIAT